MQVELDHTNPSLLDQTGQDASLEPAVSTNEPMVNTAGSKTGKKNGLDAMSLSKWNKLAERGGVGKAIASEDCMANRKGDLMFLAGDEITVLRALTEDIYLGYCEGVIGRFYRNDVRFAEELTAAAGSSGPISSHPLSKRSLQDKPELNDSSTHYVSAEPSALKEPPHGYHDQEVPHRDAARSPETQLPLTQDLLLPGRPPSPSSLLGPFTPIGIIGTTHNDGVTGVAEGSSETTAPTELRSSPTTNADQKPFEDDQHNTNVFNESASTEGEATAGTTSSKSSSASISSTWSRHTNVVDDSHASTTAAQSVATALRGFAKGENDIADEEGFDFGRPRNSRESSISDSEISWSSARESDEVSEGSIRYPTTVFLIDRMKALQIPPIRATNPFSPPAEPHSAEKPHLATSDNPDHSTGQVSAVSLAQPSPAILLSVSTPPRPPRSQLRSNQSDRNATSASSPGLVVGERVDPAGDDETADAHPSDSESQTATSNATTYRDELELPRDDGAETSSVLTGDSNPFEFGTGISAVSTPSGMGTPATEPPASGLPASSHLALMAQTMDAQRHSNELLVGNNLSVIQPVPEHLLRSQGAMKELANRFSTTSDVLRKHHVDEVGEQSYFPVVADDTGDVEDKVVDACSIPPNQTRIELGDVEQSGVPQDTTGPAPEPAANSVIAGNVRLGVIVPATPGVEEDSRSTQDETDEEWDILDGYRESSTLPETQLAAPLPNSRQSTSVLSDATFAVNSNQVNGSLPGPVNRKTSGILKIRTPVNSQHSQQNENWSQSIRTPTNTETFEQSSPEGSMSPDTRRFRAFAMHLDSPSSTPTKLGLEAKQRTVSSPYGQQSSEATKLVQEDTLHGQLTMELTSARNPVPINFLLGHSGNSPQLDSSSQNIAHSTPSGTPQQPRAAASPSPAYGKHSPKAPSSPFFPSMADKPRSRSLSTVEVPLPMHRSESSTSLQVAYAGILQHGHAADDQSNNEHEGRMRRSLSRSGTAKLSAIRRKLSLKGDQRPDLSAILSAKTYPPLPDLPPPPLATRLEGGKQPNSPSNEQTSRLGSSSPHQRLAESTAELANGHNLVQQPPIQSTPVVESLSPVSHTDRSPSVKVTNAKSANTLPPTNSSSMAPATAFASPYDEYGYLASASPVPQSFATLRSLQKVDPKLEQTLLALTEQPPNAGSSNRVKMLVYTHPIPPSVRSRVWKWLLNAPSLSHQQYQTYIDSFDIPQLDIDPSLIQRFGAHRAFMNGFQSVQQMLFLYITRHQKAPPPPETIWIASLFLTQSFHEADSYALYQSFLERMPECWTNQQLRSWAQMIEETIQVHDAELAEHLAKYHDLYYMLIRKWTLTMFAEAMPLPTCLRALDRIIIQGPSAILKLASVLILLCSQRLQRITNASEIAQFLLQPPQDWLSPENVFGNLGKIALPKKAYHQLKSGSPRI